MQQLEIMDSEYESGDPETITNQAEQENKEIIDKDANLEELLQEIGFESVHIPWIKVERQNPIVEESDTDTETEAEVHKRTIKQLVLRHGFGENLDEQESVSNRNIASAQSHRSSQKSNSTLSAIEQDSSTTEEVKEIAEIQEKISHEELENPELRLAALAQAQERAEALLHLRERQHAKRVCFSFLSFLSFNLSPF